MTLQDSEGSLLAGYFDSASTSYPKHPELSEAIAREIELGGSYGRGASQWTLRAAQRVETTRALAASYLGASSPLQIAFPPSATEALNIVIQGFPYRRRVVVTTPLEHNAVRRPLMAMARRIGLRIAYLPTRPDGSIDPENRSLARIVAGADLCIINHGSNVNGVLQPIEALSSLRLNTPILLDASQTIGTIPLHPQAWGVEYLVAPAHKALGGPTGVAMLYCRGTILPEPLILGGTGADSQRSSARQEMPSCFEQGTLNTLAIAGLQPTLLHPIVRKHSSEEFLQLLKRLEESGLCTVLRALDPAWQLELASIIPRNISPGSLQVRLEKNHGIITRSGLHCAPWAHRYLGSLRQGALRIALSPHHTPEHIERLAKAIITESK